MKGKRFGALNFYEEDFTHRVHRVATATFWRTFHHDKKIGPAGEGGGCTPTPSYIYHHVQSCGVRTMRVQNILPLFLLDPSMYSVISLTTTPATIMCTLYICMSASVLC
jgi:hypothetical protein